MTIYKGLALPVRPGPDGRAKLSTEDEQLVKIIGLHLSNSDSENPFQDIGVHQVVFEPNDPRLQPIIRARTITLFERLEANGRARLDENSLDFIHEEGELTFAFSYWNLKTNDPKDFRGTVDLMSGRVIPQ